MIDPAWLQEMDTLHDVPLQTLNTLATEVTVRQYGKGAVIYREGEPGTVVYFLRQGRVKVVRNLPDGQAQLLCVWEEGQSFGLMVALDGAPYPATAIAADACTTLSIPTKALEGHPSVITALSRGIAQRLRGHQERMGYMAIRSGPSRLAALLLQLASESGGGPVARGLTHQELGSMIGLTRETVSRALMKFRSDHLIAVDLLGLRLLNTDELRAIAGL